MIYVTPATSTDVAELRWGRWQLQNRPQELGWS